MKERGHPRFYELVDEIRDLHQKKNHDYSSDHDPLANFKLCEEFGIPAWLGCLVRISDKYSRIVQLASGKEAQVKEEAITDTLRDLSVYSLLCIILYEEAQRKEKISSKLKNIKRRK